MNHYGKKETIKSAGRVWALGFALLFLVLALLLLPLTMHAQQGVTNTFNVAQFQGADVGAKITAAQNQCLPNTAIPCTIVIDSILAVWPQGTIPAHCSNCMWVDYRAAGLFGIGSIGITGPEPWADVTRFGLTCDSGIVDNTAAWNNFLSTAQASNVHVAYFPPCTGGKYRFASKPNGIGIELKIVCGNKPVQWNPTGLPAAQLLADYNEATATNAFIDFTGSTSPGNSGIVGCQIWKGTGRTGGTALKYEGISTVARAGAGPIEDTRISGDGTWNWGLRVDCTNITTAGSQGCRDIAVRNLDIFQTTTGCMSLNDAVHFKWVQGGCFPTGGGNAHVDVTGVAGAGGNSVNIEFSEVEILDTLALDWVTNFACSACYVSNLTTTVNTVQSTFEGISNTAPTIAGQLAYITFDGSSPAGFGTSLTNSIRATNFIAVGATLPANIAAGNIVGTQLKLNSTGGLVDGQFICQRSNGSGAGTLFTCSFDGNGTTPFSLDNVNGLTLTKNIQSPTLTTTTNCASAGGTCTSASAGRVSIAAAATTVTIASTAVTANSEIFIQEDATLGTALSVTCNTTSGRTYAITTRTAGTSFVVTTSAAPVTNPACLNYRIVN